MSSLEPKQNVQYQVQINGGLVHEIEFKTGQYILAALASLASLDFEPADDFDVIKIWVPHLVEAGYGPYFFAWDGHQVLRPDNARRW